MSDPSAVPEPRATYRLQLNADFRLDDARRIVPYLARLGVSHLYLSPVLEARPGSGHGYDIVDHGRINPEIGGEEALDRLIRDLHRHRMGLLLDFVPNHMGIGPDNPWWMEVLEWGAASPRASFFDIDWDPLAGGLEGKVLLPVLGDHYGAVLERGELDLRLDPDAGALSVHYMESRFPLAPREYPALLGAAGGIDALGSIAARMEEVLRGAARSARRQEARRARFEELKGELALAAREPAVRRALVGVLANLGGKPGEPSSFDRLHALLDRQHYRLAFWRVAAFEINYRRFFDIDDLAGLRMENPELFEAGHRLLRRLLEQGAVQGLRLDHVDGLREPGAYLARLREMAEGAAGAGRDDGEASWLLVEKILAPGERLPERWAVDGTTGYEFMAAVGALQVDPAARRPLTRAWERFVEAPVGYEEVVLEAKRLIMREVLVSELNVLASRFHRIARRSRTTRDYTLTGIRTALADVVAHFRVYRTYVTAAGEVAEADRREIGRAVERARSRTRQPDTSVYDFVERVLTLELTRPGAREGYRRREVLDAALRFQQYTGPVMAKSVEDTAFYRYHRLVALNEVGGEPDRFGLPPGEFHRANRERMERHPRSMITTATHDHKRGEDVRARLAVLSEIPREWGRAARRWSRLNRRLRGRAAGAPAPARGDEYLLYQTLLGAWPVGMGPPAFEGLEELRGRLEAYMLKAMREAKQRTSWLTPDVPYEEAVREFVRAATDPERSGAFLEEAAALAERIAPAGAVNGLAQTVLRLASPGVPDTYQGTERWDLSLVDPDNRRPVDYAERAASLEAGEPMDVLLRHWASGRIKQRVLERMLDVRRRRPALFSRGTYRPLEVTGRHRARLVAFARLREEEAFVAVVPRLALPLLAEEDGGLPLPRGWLDTAVLLPDALGAVRLRDVFTGAEVSGADADAEEGALAAAKLLERLPVAALEWERSARGGRGSVAEAGAAK